MGVNLYETVPNLKQAMVWTVGHLFTTLITKNCQIEPTNCPHSPFSKISLVFSKCLTKKATKCYLRINQLLGCVGPEMEEVLTSLTVILD